MESFIIIDIFSINTFEISLNLSVFISIFAIGYTVDIVNESPVDLRIKYDIALPMLWGTSKNLARVVAQIPSPSII